MSKAPSMVSIHAPARGATPLDNKSLSRWIELESSREPARFGLLPKEGLGQSLRKSRIFQGRTRSANLPGLDGALGVRAMQGGLSEDERPPRDPLPPSRLHAPPGGSGRRRGGSSAGCPSPDRSGLPAGPLSRIRWPGSTSISKIENCTLCPQSWQARAPPRRRLRQSWTSRVQRNGSSAFIAATGGRRDRRRQRSSGPGARISPSKAPKQRVAASPAEPRTSSSVRSAKAARRRTWAMRPQRPPAPRGPPASSPPMVAKPPQEHGAQVGDLARPEGTRDVLARFRRPVGAAQKPAAADGPLDPPLEPAPRSSSASVIRAPTQAPIRAGETRIGPKAAAEESMCSGARASAAPSASATRVSPSLRSAVPSGVT